MSNLVIKKGNILFTHVICTCSEISTLKKYLNLGHSMELVSCAWYEIFKFRQNFRINIKSVFKKYV